MKKSEEKDKRFLPLLSLSSNEEFPFTNHIQYAIRCKVVRYDMSILIFIYLRRQKKNTSQKPIYTT